MALRALVKIEQHEEGCERRYQEWARTQDHVINYLKDINLKLMTMNDTIAEARGAAKMGKFLIGLISTASGAIGGLISHFTFKQ